MREMKDGRRRLEAIRAEWQRKLAEMENSNEEDFDCCLLKLKLDGR